ncbi:hypothetical protein [Azorhizobium doebereinerae]|uniref:hypothetical protein n=1 Tax=Azorhizobium doebereinerae TaxID=281091 RepID=UPI0004086094|nr:hypothetical protein [Azorhizobium doebereinerae]
MAAKETTTDERRAADAFYELEDIVLAVRNATYLMELAARDTTMRLEGGIEKVVRERFKNGEMDGYRIFLLSEEQSSGVDYALLHLGDLVRKLHEHYNAGCGKGA